MSTFDIFILVLTIGVLLSIVLHIGYDFYNQFIKRKWGVYMSITQIIIISLGAIVCVGYIIYSIVKFKKAGPKKWLAF